MLDKPFDELSSDNYAFCMRNIEEVEEVREAGQLRGWNIPQIVVIDEKKLGVRNLW